MCHVSISVELVSSSVHLCGVHITPQDENNGGYVKDQYEGNQCSLSVNITYKGKR